MPKQTPKQTAKPKQQQKQKQPQSQNQMPKPTGKHIKRSRKPPTKETTSGRTTAQMVDSEDELERPTKKVKRSLQPEAQETLENDAALVGRESNAPGNTEPGETIEEIFHVATERALQKHGSPSATAVAIHTAHIMQELAEMVVEREEMNVMRWVSQMAGETNRFLMNSRNKE